MNSPLTRSSAPQPAAPEPEALSAYQHLAAHYDAFTAHHDYDLWLGNLLERALGLGLGREPGALLDVACGTGKSFLPMLERGWHVTAVDLSPAMAARAQAKAPGVRVGVADMRSLPVLGSYDLVWCLDDAVNYLANPAELTKALRAMAANLRPEGLVIFDVNTLATYRTFFAETQTVEAGDICLRWRGLGDGVAVAGDSFAAEFQVISSQGPLSQSTHWQRHFSVADIRQGLEGAGLELLDLRGHGFDAILKTPMDEDLHTKAVVFASRR